MTQEERENPELLEKQSSRIQRIAKGSGTTSRVIREMLSQYSLLKSFIKSGKDFSDLDITKLQKGGLGLSQKKLRKLAKKFKFKF
jgi:signal recognition particle GTPase